MRKSKLQRIRKLSYPLICKLIIFYCKSEIREIDHIIIVFFSKKKKKKSKCVHCEQVLCMHSDRNKVQIEYSIVYVSLVSFAASISLFKLMTLVH